MTLRVACTFAALLLAAGCDTTITDPGRDAGVEAGTDAGLVGSPNCPSKGGTMREIPEPSGASFCIDQTEVTNAAYAKWLDTDPSQNLRPDSVPGFAPGYDGCIGPPIYVGKRLTYEPLVTMTPDGQPSVDWPQPPDRDDYPVEHVDWCDAYAFCTDNGKRLCGKVGGGNVTGDMVAAQHPRVSEIYDAATRDGTQAYPYGDTFDPKACGPDVVVSDGESSGSKHIIAKLRPVASLPTCEGGYPGLYDLLGNVAEFYDACGGGPAGAGCLVAGAMSYPPHGGNSGNIEDGSLQWGYTARGVGFRCCADPIAP
jgi:hypothetical protein